MITTPAGTFWLKDRSKAAAVAANLVNLRNPYIRAVYYRPSGALHYVRAPGGPALGVLRGGVGLPVSTRNMVSPSAPQVVMFLTENTSIVGRNETNWRGDHGGASWNAEHIPLDHLRTGGQTRYPLVLPGHHL